MTPRLMAATLGVIAVALGAMWLTNVFLRFGPLELMPAIWDGYPLWALDFRSYHDAAARVLDAGSPYASELVGEPFEPGPGGLYYYSPVLAVSLLPVAGISLIDSSVWWFILQMVALVGACALMPVRPLTRALAFAIVALSLAVFKDVIYGNVSILLLLPMAMAWRWMDRPLGSIALAISISIRPGLGLLLIWQLLRRRWRVAAWTIGSGLVLIAVTLPVVGMDGYLDYLRVLGNLGLPTGDAPGSFGWENHDFGQVVRSAGASVAVTDLVRMGSVLLGVGAMLLSLRRDRETSFMVTLMASMLVVPMLWDHYLTMLVFPAAFLADRWRPVAILLPLLAWLPSIAAFTVAVAMILPFFVRDAADAVEATEGVRGADAHDGISPDAGTV